MQRTGPLMLQRTTSSGTVKHASSTAYSHDAGETRATRAAFGDYGKFFRFFLAGVVSPWNAARALMRRGPSRRLEWFQTRQPLVGLYPRSRYL